MLVRQILIPAINRQTQCKRTATVGMMVDINGNGVSPENAIHTVLAISRGGTCLGGRLTLKCGGASC